MNNQMDVVIDHREQKLKEHFLTNPQSFPISYENLPIGDIKITMDGELVLLVERKTIPDLAASIRDGRYKRQKLDLLASTPRKQLVYLVEGRLDFEENDTQVCGVSKKGLISAFINTMLRDDIKVVNTNDMNDTINFIADVCTRIAETPSKYTSRGGEQLETELAPKARSSAAGMTTEKFFINMLCQVPGVSLKTAKALASSFGTLSGFFQQMHGKDDTEKLKILKAIKTDNGKGSQRAISQTVLNNIIQFCF